MTAFMEYKYDLIVKIIFNEKYEDLNQLKEICKVRSINSSI